MTLQKTPNAWSCLLVAFAMAIDEPYQTLIEEIGHDGSEQIWPQLPMPYCCRAFHPAEFIEPLLKRNRIISHIDRFPLSRPANYYDELPFSLLNDERFNKLLQTFPGVLLGSTHAVAWDGLQIYDPKGFISNSFNARAFLATVKI